MKVKIGDKIYDPATEPIMVILTEEDKKNISQMKNETKYCAFPDEVPMDKIKEFMKI